MAIELDPFLAEAFAARAAVSGVVLPERDDPIRPGGEAGGSLPPR
jgi:hypothetical protein